MILPEKIRTGCIKIPPELSGRMTVKEKKKEPIKKIGSL